MTKLYHADNLDDLAAAFERTAKEYDEKSNRATSRTDEIKHLTRATTWREAANILRNVQLKG